MSISSMVFQTVHCKQCFKSLNQKSNMKTHIAKHHNNTSEKVYPNQSTMLKKSMDILDKTNYVDSNEPLNCLSSNISKIDSVNIQGGVKELF